jgi:hypothetical protein
LNVSFEYKKVVKEVFLIEKFKSAIFNSSFMFNDSAVIELIVPPDVKTPIF